MLCDSTFFHFAPESVDRALSRRVKASECIEQRLDLGDAADEVADSSPSALRDSDLNKAVKRVRQGEEVGDEVGKEEGGLGKEKGVDGGVRKEAGCPFNGVSFVFSFFG